MAQIPKGPRKQISSRVPDEVYVAIHILAQERGTNASQLLADMAAEFVGRPDLVWARPGHQETLIEEFRATG